MKRLLIAITLIMGLTVIPIYAVDVSTDTATVDQTEKSIEDSENSITGEEREEETQRQIEEVPLSEELNVEQSSNISLPSILLAVLTPALLIVVAYLLIRMSRK